MGHFFGAMGTEAVIVCHGDVLVDREDQDIAERLTDAHADKHELHLGYEATALAADDVKTVTAESDGGDEINVQGEELLITTGRKPNTDRWNVEAANLETNEEDFVQTDESLETSTDGAWAIGDIAGSYMFKRSGAWRPRTSSRTRSRGPSDRRIPRDGPCRLRVATGRRARQNRVRSRR